jgi:hydrogenase maturation protease
LRVHLIGVGTRHGDDAAGLAVAEALAARALPDGVAVHVCERPLPDLLDALEGAEAAVIVDASRTGAAPGSLQRLTRGELARTGSTSSHGLGVAQALALAQALGRAPARVELLAIEATGRRRATLSPAVAAALPGAVDSALAIAREIQGSFQEGPRNA